ncbi:lipoprotein [Hyphomonas sp.]|uniref:LptM family lipoprotein n=1 Tax=Hyphomonas sp. TaxID=87 RepID=UPI003919FA62
MKRLLGAATALVLLGGVSACGLTGDLKRPGPLIGNPSDVDPASLPDAEDTSLPSLPDRPSEAAAEETEDELLGGPSN